MSFLSLSSSRAERAVALLSHDAHAPRVFRPATLLAYLAARQVPLSRAFLMERLPSWEEAGHLLRVRRGIYLNQRALPAPTLGEAVPWIRQGAVVSLGYALGQAGVLKHHSDQWVTAVFPLTSSHAVGTFQEGGRIFQMAGLRPALLPWPGTHPWAFDAYDLKARVLTATPEKALLDWWHLAQTSSHWMPPSPQSIHWDRLDLLRLERLAQAMGLHAVWARRYQLDLMPPEV